MRFSPKPVVNTLLLIAFQLLGNSLLLFLTLRILIRRNLEVTGWTERNFTFVSRKNESPLSEQFDCYEFIHGLADFADIFDQMNEVNLQFKAVDYECYWINERFSSQDMEERKLSNVRSCSAGWKWKLFYRIHSADIWILCRTLSNVTLARMTLKLEHG